MVGNLYLTRVGSASEQRLLGAIEAERVREHEALRQAPNDRDILSIILPRYRNALELAAQLVSSRSWRLTAPFRALSNMVRPKIPREIV